VNEKKKSNQNKGKSITFKVENILSRMTIKEKVAQLGSVSEDELLINGKFSPEKAEKLLKNGVGQITRMGSPRDLSPKYTAQASNDIQKYLEDRTRLGIPAIIVEECLSGYMGKSGTIYPQAIGLASTWDPDLIMQITSEIKKQLVGIGIHLALSPVVDVVRDMRWGRVEETFGEDAYLVASMGLSYVKGLQGSNPKNGIFATLKHFGGHGFSEGGRNHAPVHVGCMELREEFLLPFEILIKKGEVNSVMSAYHEIDGIPCTASKELLTNILRKEWGFGGIVVSDYFSIKMLYTDHKIVQSKQEAGLIALEAGVDIELPRTECYGENLVDAIKKGLVSENLVDKAVKRHLEMKFKLGLFDKRRYVEIDEVPSLFETTSQRKLARKVAKESIILLKNEDSILPLNKNIKNIAVIGPNADSERNLLGDYAYPAHAEVSDNTVPIISILKGISKKLSKNTKIHYVKGCDILSESTKGFSDAVRAANDSEVTLLILGGKSGFPQFIVSKDDNKVIDLKEIYKSTNTSGEFHDRTNLQLLGAQLKLAKTIYKTGKPIVVVLINGRPLAVDWISKNIPAIIEAWLPGEEGGNAVADVLFGDYNPGGKLPVSIPRNVGQTPVNYNRTYISLDRRYIDMDTQPLYPFGHGLSYTRYDYRDLTIKPKQAQTTSKIAIGITLKNIGRRNGDEVVQLYIHDKIASRTRPAKELKGFRRISLIPSEEKRITFILSPEQFAFYDRDMNLVVEPGVYEVMIGSSSTDIRARGEFEILGAKKGITREGIFFTKVKVI